MNLDNIATKCAACGQCRAVCPAFRVSDNREPESPRGRVLISRDLLREKLTPTRGAAQSLGNCLLCNSCVAECPSGVNVDHLVMGAREELARKRGLPAVKRGLLAAFSRPRLLALGARMGSVMIPLLGTRSGGHPWPPAWWPFGETRRNLPAPAVRPLSRLLVAKREPSFIFFRGCLVEEVSPSIGLALTGLARGQGMEPGLVKDERCCGIPLLAAGDIKGFRRLVAHNLSILDRDDLPVVTACASCTSTLTKYYVEYCSPDLRERALALAGRVTDAVSLLSGWDLPTSRHLGRWTYHQPCHHHKGHPERVDGARVLEQMEGVEYAAPRDPDACCGFGGSYSLDHYEKASTLADERLRDLLETGARGAATGCPGCMVHLRDAVARSGRDFPVRHILELAWEQAQALDSSLAPDERIS